LQELIKQFHWPSDCRISIDLWVAELTFDGKEEVSRANKVSNVVFGDFLDLAPSIPATYGTGECVPWESLIEYLTKAALPSLSFETRVLAALLILRVSKNVLNIVTGKFFGQFTHIVYESNAYAESIG